MSSASSSKKPRFSVVIVTYNSRDNIQACLDSLRRCSGRAGDHEYIVVDNASRDATPDYLARQEDVIALLEKENHGFSRGCNLGAAKARGEFLIFLNPDTLATPGWSEAMAAYFRDPGTGAVGPLSNYVAGLQRADMHMPPPYDKGAEIPGDGITAKTDAVAKMLKEANAGRGVLTKLLIGFCLMIRRELYEAMGGMDERLFLGNDDLDLSWRLRERGLKLVVASDSFVFHEGQKSFKTEAKSHVDRLVQESTDALYLKLVDHYGGRDKVPSSLELWGMTWFNPSPELLRDDHSTGKAEARMATSDNKQNAAWRGVTLLVYLAPGKGSEAARVERTLSTLPANPSDVVLLNCSGWSGTFANQPGNLRRLDLGAACAPKAALELATALAQDHILFCAAGVGFTALFNHWLDKRAGSLPAAGVLPDALPLPIRAEDGRTDGGLPESARGEFPGCAFLVRKTWLREALGAMPASLSGGQPSADAAAFLAGLAQSLERAAAGDKSLDPPWLLARAADLPVAAPASAQAPSGSSGASVHGSWTPVKGGDDRSPAAGSGKWNEAISNYPEILAGPMRGAQDIAFAGTIADTLPVKGPFRVFDMQGERVPFKDQDLVILRLTPDLVEALPERLANLRRRGESLRRLMVVLNSRQALRKPQPEGGLLPAVDVTPDGARAALWQAGFAVISEKPYNGFPPVQGAVGDMEGWTLVEAAPRSAAHRLEKKVSIVILGFNQVEYTRKCIESIRKHTRQAYELILVDNGSKDGTEEYFRSIPGAKVIRNAENQGVSKGWNQGMRLADGDYFLIFNNDTIVGPGWLENMVRLCESDSGIGMVGPRSNYIAGPQIVPKVPYRTEAEIQDYIAKWQGDHDLSAAEFGFIKGFCLLIPRPVFDKVGFFDERFGKGNFEDDDYCLRVRYHGYRTLFAHDSFIHHYGSVSFNQESVDWKALMIENQQKYALKWSRGAAALNDTVVSDPGPAVREAMSRNASPSPMGSPGPLPAGVAEAHRAYEAGDIPRARTLFLDAQSRNPGHPEPLCGLGAIAFHDGSHMDAGKLFMRCLELDPAHADAAQNLLEVLELLENGLHPGDVMSLADRFPANAVFRAKAAELRGKFPASSPAAPAVPATAAPKPLPAWRAEVEDRISRRQFAPAIDALEARRRSGQDLPACYNYLGVIAHSCGDHAFAADNFRAALKHGPAEADAIYNLADTLVAMGRAVEALGLLDVPPEMGPGQAAEAEMPAAAEQIRAAIELGKVDAARLSASREHNQKAEQLLRDGNPAGAAAILEGALAEDARDFRALNNMGLAEWYQGRAESAWKRFRACLEIRPAWTDALINGFDAALAAGLMADFAPCLRKALAVRPDHPEARRMSAYIDREGLAIHDCRNFQELEADAVLLAKGDKAVQEGRKSDAINVFIASIERRSRNPQALNGLGIVAFAEQRHVDAYALFEAAATLNPMDQDILLNLWQAARALRREGDVLPKLKTSLERNPALHDVKAILEGA